MQKPGNEALIQDPDYNKATLAPRGVGMQQVISFLLQQKQAYCLKPGV